MVLDRYVLRLWLAPFLSGLGIVIGVLLLSRILKVLGLIAERNADWSIVGLMLAAAMPYFLVLTLPIAFFFAGQSAIVKLTQDSEMDALRASGISSWRVIRPLVLVAMLIWVATTWCTMQWMPVGQKTFQGLVYALQKSKGTLGFDAKRFNKFDDFIVYVGGEEADGSYRDFMLEDMRSTVPVYYLAERARMVRNGRFLNCILSHGTRFEGSGEQQRILAFAEYNIAIDVGQLGMLNVPKWRSRAHEMTFRELLKARQKSDTTDLQAEWARRWILPTTVLVLLVYLLPLSIAPKRSGKAGAYGLGIALLLAVFNIQVVAHQQVSAGHAGVWLMWVSQLSMFTLGLWLTRLAVSDRLPGVLALFGEWRLLLHERLLAMVGSRK